MAISLDSFARVLWWLFGGSVGGATRSRVLFAIKEQPKNAQQLAKSLNLDYTTIRHHLRVLVKNNMVVTSGEGYGKLYFLSNSMETRWGDFELILEKTGHGRKGGQIHAAE